jgi:hypothetical protein
MFGHLKPEEFVNMMESEEVPARRRAHIESCASCRKTWESLKPVHSEFTSMDEDILEPDWSQFRSSVRDQLLSRSVQRQSTMRRWTGWAVRPAMAWVLSLLLAVGIPTGALLWHLQRDRAAEALSSNGVQAPAMELIDAGADKAVFDDLIQLNDTEQEQLQKLIESARKESPKLELQ